jgi:hypothetical protein
MCATLIGPSASPSPFSPSAQVRCMLSALSRKRCVLLALQPSMPTPSQSATYLPIPVLPRCNPATQIAVYDTVSNFGELSHARVAVTTHSLMIGVEFLPDFNSSPSPFDGQCLVARWRYGTPPAGGSQWESTRSAFGWNTPTIAGGYTMTVSSVTVYMCVGQVACGVAWPLYLITACPRSQIHVRLWEFRSVHTGRRTDGGHSDRIGANAHRGQR